MTPADRCSKKFTFLPGADERVSVSVLCYNKAKAQHGDLRADVGYLPQTRTKASTTSSLQS